MKTGSFKELAPYDPDWYYVRAGELCQHTPAPWRGRLGGVGCQRVLRAGGGKPYVAQPAAGVAAWRLHARRCSSLVNNVDPLTQPICLDVGEVAWRRL